MTYRISQCRPGRALRGRRLVFALGLLASLGLLQAGAAVSAEDRQQVDGLIEQAKRTEDSQTRIRLLEQSLALAPTFQAWYMLGRTYQQEGTLEDAGKAFEKAWQHARGDKREALAMGRAAETMMDQDELADGLNLARSAVERYPGQAPSWMTELVLRGDIDRSKRIASSRSISTVLSGTGRSKAFGVRVRRIDLHINFATRSHDINSTPEARQQIDALADAVRRLGSIDQRYKLVGHADKRGSEEYNMALSQRRADSVKAYVAAQVPEVAGLLCTDAKGELQPLHPLRRADNERHPDNDDVHRVNRRVEVVIVDQCR